MVRTAYIVLSHHCNAYTHVGCTVQRSGGHLSEHCIYFRCRYFPHGEFMLLSSPGVLGPSSAQLCVDLSGAGMTWGVLE